MRLRYGPQREQVQEMTLPGLIVPELHLALTSILLHLYFNVPSAKNKLKIDCQMAGPEEWMERRNKYVIWTNDSENQNYNLETF